MISIRSAGQRDAALIADLSRQTFLETFSAFNTPENMELFMNGSFNRQQLMDEAGLPDNYFFLAYDDDIPVGYARVRSNNNPPELEGRQTIEIARIYAVKSSIGRGVGKALMEACITLGRSLGKELVWLGVWESNEPAISFYNKWGFTRFSEHEFILGKDIQTDWLMMKKL